MNNLVSIVMPTYNRRSTIERAISSVQNQSYQNWELIIVDDGSTDDTDCYIQSLKDDRIHYVRNEKNLGANASRNVGIRFAKGEYIAFLDSDNAWISDKLEKQLARMNDQIQMVYCAFNYHKDGNVLVIPTDVNPYSVEEYSEDLLKILTKNNVVDTSTILVRRDFLTEIGTFDEEMPRLQDYELAIRIAKNGNVSFISEPLVEVFYSFSSISAKPLSLVKAELLLMEKHSDLYDAKKCGEKWMSFIRYAHSEHVPPQELLDTVKDHFENSSVDNQFAAFSCLLHAFIAENDKGPLVSIIVPVHNTGEYLRECLNSIWAQTYGRYELILVDDDSDDQNTLDILALAEARHQTRVIYEKQPVGAAGARNIGFQQANGVYTLFLDSDDLFAPYMLEKLVCRIEDIGAQVCIMPYQNFEVVDGCRRDVATNTAYMANALVNRVSEDEASLAGFMPYTPWCKMVRTDFLREHQIEFQNLLSCNDVFFSHSIALLADSFCYTINVPMVYHRVNTKTQTSFNRDPIMVYHATRALVDKFKADLPDFKIQQIMFAFVNSFYTELNKGQNVLLQKKAYEEVQEYLRTEWPELHFLDGRLENIKANLMSNPFETLWWCENKETKFYIKYKDSQLLDEIVDQIEQYNAPVIWGFGARGKALYRCLQERDVSIAVTDRNEMQSITSLEEYKFYANAFKEADFIIATNSAVYKDVLGLQLLNTSKAKVIDLSAWE